MQPIKIEGTKKTPTINFDPIAGKLEISGVSLHENPHKFFEPVFSWLNDYCLDPQKTTSVTINLDYFNSSSLRALKIIIDKLQELCNGGNIVKLQWYYDADDEDALDDVQFLKGNVTYDFEILAN